ncbi:MAG: type II toxin-antitoxin system Phd/YefM family antitoxin [Planctomycetes bacterium]|nr:type II toxin-antitoxin system Phd/YefM family antitoxin [Planctomycetota bacterium]MBI3843810.1 type II toxin-antitoxin system Phd/YefM family antitoxin [Planctomycetota bacterium]
MKEQISFNIAEAKKRFSELIGRVAVGGISIVITRRGRPMAKLVPWNSPEGSGHLGDVKGWLDEDDSFFATVDEIVKSRSKHAPRALLRGTPPGRSSRNRGR